MKIGIHFFGICSGVGKDAIFRQYRHVEELSGKERARLEYKKDEKYQKKVQRRKRRKHKIKKK